MSFKSELAFIHIVKSKTLLKNTTCQLLIVQHIDAEIMSGWGNRFAVVTESQEEISRLLEIGANRILEMASRIGLSKFKQEPFILPKNAGTEMGEWWEVLF